MKIGRGQGSLNRLDIEKARQFWSFRPISDPEIPSVRSSDWPSTDIDRFVLAKLEARQLQPLGPADKRTFIRRASFDLTGLPPTPEQVEEFLRDTSSEAINNTMSRPS